MLTYESHHFGQNHGFNHYHNYDFSFPNHLHRSFELLYVKSGEIKVSINSRSYSVKENQCILILPYEVHSFTTISHSDSYICVFAPEYVKTFHNMVDKKFIDNPVFSLSPEIQSVVTEKIFKDNDNILEMKGCLYLICSELSTKSNILDDKQNDYELLHKTLMYIQENFTTNITLKSVAENLGYSYNYLSRSFNNMLQISFVDFINENRINYSLYLLRNSTSTITEIAYLCGYSSIRSFNRNFRNIMHISPSKYRHSKKIVEKDNKLTEQNTD